MLKIPGPARFLPNNLGNTGNVILQVSRPGGDSDHERIAQRNLSKQDTSDSLKRMLVEEFVPQ